MIPHIWMEPEQLAETIINGFAIYGVMWVIILFMLLLSHLSIDEPRPKNKDTDQISSDDDGE